METKYKSKKVNGKKIDEHRLVMEENLGRKLELSEVVHHIDGDKSNNDLDNLQLFPSRCDHTKHHFNKGDYKLIEGRNKKKMTVNGKVKC